MRSKCLTGLLGVNGQPDSSSGAFKLSRKNSD